MKSMTLKITLLAFVALAAFSCKNNTEKNDTALEEAAEANEAAAQYSVDTDASVIKWEGEKPTRKHFGIIKLESGNISVHEGAVEAATFNIDMNSIEVHDLEGDDRANLEAHLKGTAEGKEGDFFDATKYPKAKFELTSVDNGMVKGNLTIKDKTQAVEFPAQVNIEGDKLTIASEPFVLDRTKWGVNFGSKSIFPNLGDKFVSDDMLLNISLVANKI